MLSSFFRESWGTGKASVAMMAPGLIGDERLRSWLGRCERVGSGPTSATALLRWLWDADVRSVLPSIQAKTLVLQHEHTLTSRVEFSRYLADHIPGARFEILRGSDFSLFTADAESLVDRIADFVTGQPVLPDADRALATVLSPTS